MSRLLIGNFDFEWSLAHPASPLPQHLRRLSSELACAWLAVAEPDDVLVLPQPVASSRPHNRPHSPAGELPTAQPFHRGGEGRGEEESQTSSASLLSFDLPWKPPTVCTGLSNAPPHAIPIPWGWSDRIVAELHQARLPLPPRPTCDVVRRVNSRRFSRELERELGCGLTGAAWLTSLVDVEAALAECISRHPTDARWVIKADLSNSARERLLGRGDALSNRDRAWLEGRLQMGGVALEPWVEIVAEAGVQWEIPVDGEPVLVGVVPQLTDAAGHYRGSLFAPAQDAASEWSDAVAVSRLAAQHIQSAGYFGPLGIDACRYRTPAGELRLRPLQDVNARWTMGRLSLGWRRLLAPGEIGLWRHGPPNATLRAGTALPTHPPDRIIATSPTHLAGSPCRLQHRVEIYRP